MIHEKRREKTWITRGTIMVIIDTIGVSWMVVTMSTMRH